MMLCVTQPRWPSWCGGNHVEQGLSSFRAWLCYLPPRINSVNAIFCCRHGCVITAHIKCSLLLTKTVLSLISTSTHFQFHFHSDSLSLSGVGGAFRTLVYYPAPPLLLSWEEVKIDLWATFLPNGLFFTYYWHAEARRLRREAEMRVNT